MKFFLLASLFGSPDAAIEQSVEASAAPAAEYLAAPLAGYPILAQQTGAEADCRIRVIADSKGRPIRADVDASQPEGLCPEPFRTQAIYAAWRGQLAPVEVGGRPVPFTFVQEVAFAPFEGDVMSSDAIADSTPLPPGDH